MFIVKAQRENKKESDYYEFKSSMYKDAHGPGQPGPTPFGWIRTWVLIIGHRLDLKLDSFNISIGLKLSNRSPALCCVID